ncbi:hypothetical protein SAY87_015398 [Trapa incisa]|uniref:Uncharacterized protein n=1 Tax=Trapa incisa TaxID=236973 RepID=A0AAN7H3Q4_9MYRT|nr:hypothetical protein SAY87_015398 [Trapa incisa]
MKLASRSFFQDFERDGHGNIIRCKMHDLMHDLAIMVAGICGALRLHRLAKGDVLRSIGKLKHLRSLDLSRSTKLTSLPISLGKLLNLETLILYGCEKLESLPREVTKLANLRHLDMRGCDSLTCMPWGIGNLTNLEVLRGFRVEERGKWNAARMNELRRLTGLEELSIEYLGGVKKESDSAANFWIDKLPLQRLHLSFPLRRYLSEYLHPEEEEDNKAIQGIPNSQTKMRELRLVGMDKMKTLPPWIQYLPKLEILALSDCKNMETLPGWFSQLTSLKTLTVIGCGELPRKCQRDKGEYWPRISYIENVIAYEEEAA